MKSLNSLFACLVLGTAILPTLISPAAASSCRLNTGLYQHEDGTELRLYKVENGGYQLNVPVHNYTVNGQCDGNQFFGFGGSEESSDIIVLEKKGSNSYYYYAKKDPGGGAWYKYRY